MVAGTAQRFAARQQLARVEDQLAYKISVEDSTSKSRFLENEITRLEAELNDVRTDLRGLGDGAAQPRGMARGRATAPTGPAKPTFDDRKLKVKPYSGVKSTWRDFYWTLSSFIKKESADLGRAMDKAIKADAEILEDKVADYGINAELDQELACLLLAAGGTSC